MDGFSEENLSQILGNDPVATSVRIRIRQDEQAINNLTLGYRAAKQEIEGMVKALEKSGLLTGKLTDALAKVTGAAGGGMVGNTSVAGSKPIQRTPIDKGIGTNVSSRSAGGQAGAQAGAGTPSTPGTIQMTPLDKGVQTSTSIGQRLQQAGQQLKQSLINYGAPPPPPPPGGPSGPTTVRGAIADAAIPATNSILAASASRIDQNRAYSLQADRVNMVFQQMKGMSQEQTQNVYRDPLTKYKLGAGGKNEVLAMEAMTGLKSSIMAPAIEAMRVQSGFSMTAGQATGMIENMASPEVVNRMFMMTGTSLIGPGGVQNDPTKVMQDVIKKAGLTNPDILRSAAQPGSVSRANLTQMGITGAMQDQYIQYAQMDLQFQEKTKGKLGMYDAGNKQHQKVMGISDNFAMQAEETERRRGEREENFYSRQADNYADLEKATQKVIAVMGKLEDKMSGLFGLQIESSWMKGALGAKGALAAGAAGNLFGGAIRSMGGLIGSVSKAVGWVGKIAGMGDFVTADQMERRVINSTLASGSTSSGSTWGKTSTIPQYVAAPKTTSSGTTSSGTTSAGTTSTRRKSNNDEVGLRMYGPQVPSKSGLRGFNRNTRSSFQNAKTPSLPKKLLSRELTDAEVDEGWAMIPGGNTFTDLKREAIMAFTPTRFRNKAMTLGELARIPEFLNMHPATQRAFQDAAMAAFRENKEPLGLQSGWRSPIEQHNLFISRYKPVGYETNNFYQGQYWDKKDPSYADVATPGAAWSNHEHGLALDVIGDKKWLADNAHRFGLEGFKEVNNEDWHFQIAGLREKGTGGGAGYNERTGFTSPGIELGQDGYKVDGTVGENDIIQALYDAGIKTSRWTRNVNGTDTPIGIDFMPVRFKDGKGYDFRKVDPADSSAGKSSLHGSADAMERWILGGKKGKPPVSQFRGSADAMERWLSGGKAGKPPVAKDVMDKLVKGQLNPVSGKGYPKLTMDQAAKMLYDAGFRGKELVDALAIMWRESSGNPNVRNNSYNEFNPDGTRKGQDVSYGLFQHNFNPSQMNTAGNVRDWNLSGSPEDWASGAGQDLYNPERNIALAYERFAYYKNHGGTGWEPWVNDGVSHLYGAEDFVKPAMDAAMRVGVYNIGDYVPKSVTDKPIRDKSSKPTPYKRELNTTLSSYGSAPAIDIKTLREHLPMPSPTGLANMSDRGITQSGAGATIMPTSNNITISPSITISTNGATVEQELEGLARKVAGMLEKEVNRVMLRRT